MKYDPKKVEILRSDTSGWRTGGDATTPVLSKLYKSILCRTLELEVAIVLSFIDGCRSELLKFLDIDRNTHVSAL